MSDLEPDIGRIALRAYGIVGTNSRGRVVVIAQRHNLGNAHKQAKTYARSFGNVRILYRDAYGNLKICEEGS
jgi:hypothetical protein